MRSLGIIPARGGSRSIPWKNLAELKGKHLIGYTIEAALASSLTKVIVSTDAERIRKVAEKFGAEVIMRPPDLARDDTPTLPVLVHAFETLGGEFDYVVTLQPTSPFRTAKHIDEALNLFRSHPSADTLVSVVEVPHNMVPSSLMRLEEGRLETLSDAGRTILRRQDKPKLFARNGPAILIMTPEQMRSGELYSGVTLPYVMDWFSSVDIDDDDNLALAGQVQDWRRKDD